MLGGASEGPHPVAIPGSSTHGTPWGSSARPDQGTNTAFTVIATALSARRAFAERATLILALHVPGVLPSLSNHLSYLFLPLAWVVNLPLLINL